MPCRTSVLFYPKAPRSFQRLTNDPLAHDLTNTGILRGPSPRLKRLAQMAIPPSYRVGSICACEDKKYNAEMRTLLGI